MIYTDLLALAESSPLVESGGSSSLPSSPGAIEGDRHTGNGHAPADYDPMSADRSICSEIGLDVLGEHPDREILVFSERLAKSSTIPRINTFSFADLLQVAGPAVREHVHTSQDAPPGSHHFNRVKEAIATLAGRKRIRDQEARGAGVWPGEAGRVVIVGGSEAAVYNPDTGELDAFRRPIAAGQLLDLGGARWQDFARLRKDLAAARDQAWRQAALDQTLEIFGRWRWREGCEHYLVTGLVLAGWIQTLWPWRPHVAISAESGGGKSTLLAAIRDLYGSLALYSAKPTEAGFRQAIRNRACIPLIDEFEADRHRRAILELLRTAGTGTTILRGTRNQHGAEYGLRHICWVAGVEAGLHRQPDRNRFLMLDLLPPAKEARNRLRVPSADDLGELGQRLLAIALWGTRDALRLAGVLRQESLGNLDARTVESLAVPAAALAVAMGLPDGQARELLTMLAQQIDAGGDGGEQESDQEKLLGDILSSIVRLDRSEQATVAELLRRETEAAWDALARVGIAAAGDDPGRPPEPWQRTWLFLWPRPIARQLLRDTEWADQSLGQLLARLPGAERGRGYLNGHRCKGIRVPFSLIRELVGGGDSASMF